MICMHIYITKSLCHINQSCKILNISLEKYKLCTMFYRIIHQLNAYFFYFISEKERGESDCK